jgi:HPt (histidine-containing phosphotransfer) domain-containing protein
MTALVMQGDRERCLAAGMDGYLTKPIRPRALDEVLDIYVEQKKQSNTASESEPKPSAQPSTSSELPSVDGHELLDRVGGDREFLAELVTLFREDGPKQIGRIKTALENKEAGEMLRGAHSLRGSLANLAARPAADLAATIEVAGQSADLAQAEIALHSLEREMTRVLNALSALCGEAIP